MQRLISMATYFLKSPHHWAGNDGHTLGRLYRLSAWSNSQPLRFQDGERVLLMVQKSGELTSWYGCFPKMVGFPNKPMGFPTKNDHFGMFWGTTIFGNTHMVNIPMIYRVNNTCQVVGNGISEPSTLCSIYCSESKIRMNTRVYVKL